MTLTSLILRSVLGLECEYCQGGQACLFRLEDEAPYDRASADLPTVYFSVVAASVPLSANLFSLCDLIFRALWFFSRQSSGSLAYSPLPSL